MTDKEIKSKLKVIKWARANGALLIKVGDIELTFPPYVDDPQVYVKPPVQDSIIEDKKKAEQFIRAPTALDDPDYYISEQDKWATNTRPPPLR